MPRRRQRGGALEEEVDDWSDAATGCSAGGSSQGLQELVEHDDTVEDVVELLTDKRRWQREETLRRVFEDLTMKAGACVMSPTGPDVLLDALLRGPVRKGTSEMEISLACRAVSALFVLVGGEDDISTMWLEANRALRRVEGVSARHACVALALACFVGSKEEEEHLAAMAFLEDMIVEGEEYGRWEMLTGAVQGWALLAGIAPALAVERAVALRIGRPLRHMMGNEDLDGQPGHDELRLSIVRALGVALDRVSDEGSDDDDLYYDEESEDGGWADIDDSDGASASLRPAMSKVAKALRRVVDDQGEKSSGRRVPKGEREWRRAMTLEASAALDGSSRDETLQLPDGEVVVCTTASDSLRLGVIRSIFGGGIADLFQFHPFVRELFSLGPVVSKPKDDISDSPSSARRARKEERDNREFARSQLRSKSRRRRIQAAAEAWNEED